MDGSADVPPAPLDPLLPLALFLDFDGTLVEIADDPAAVQVGADLQTLLGRVRSVLSGRLAIVTGRPLAAVDRFFPDLALDACGLHGLEYRIGGQVHRPDLPSLEHELPALHAALDRFPGVLVENKRYSLAAHWRRAPEAETACREAIGQLAARLGPAYREQAGKMLMEVLPAGGNKGAGIASMMGERPYAGSRPVFAGDDRTDEHGFTAVAGIGGAGVKVGPGPTEARWRLPDTVAVHRWLEGLADGDPYETGLLSA